MTAYRHFDRADIMYWDGHCGQLTSEEITRESAEHDLWGGPRIARKIGSNQTRSILEIFEPVAADSASQAHFLDIQIIYGRIFGLCNFPDLAVYNTPLLPCRLTTG